MSGAFVTVRTALYPHEFAVLQNCLEAEGVECFVRDELSAQVNNYRALAMGGIKLQIRQEDLQRAVGIMREGGFIAQQDLASQHEENFLARFFMKLFCRKR